MFAADHLDVANGQALPADVGPDQRGVDVDDLALGDPRVDAGPHGALEDAAEALGAPALADPGQPRMIGQRLVQAIAAEPADREVDLRLPHEPPVVNDPEQEARRASAVPPPRGRCWAGRPRRRRGRRPPRAASQIEHAVHPDQHVVVRQHVTQRPGDEQLRLPTLLATQHPGRRPPAPTTAGGKRTTRPLFSTTRPGAAGGGRGTRGRPQP